MAQVWTSSAIRYAVFALAIAALVVVAARATILGGRGRAVAFAALRDGGAGLLVLTGTVLLVHWALTGRAARALDGSALLLVGGGLLLVAGPWGALLNNNPTDILISPGARLALNLPALALLIRSPSVVPIDSSVRPIRALTGAAGCSLGLLGVEAIVRLWGPVGAPGVWIAAMIVLSLGWIVAGMRRISTAGSVRAVTGERAFGWSLVAFGFGDVLLAISLHADLVWGVFGVAAQLAGSVGAATVAVAWLVAELSRDGNRKFRLGAELADVTTVLADEQSERRQMLHDARNVLTAIHAATVTLERHGDRLDPVVQDQLRTAVGSEFERLQSLFNQPHGSADMTPSEDTS
jgi:signal transduction histidine kinase